MAKYLYGGVLLYELPVHAGYDYKVIVYHDDVIGHALILSTEPFKVVQSRIAFPSTANHLVYSALLNTTWQENSLNVEEGDGNHTAIPEGSVFKWCSHTIRDLNGNEVYVATDPILAASQPTVTVSTTTAKYVLGDTATPIACNAITTDGGDLTYVWYKSDGTQIATTREFTPDVSATGTTEYYCIVTNTLNGTSETTKSVIVKVIVGKALHALSLYMGWLIGKKIAEMTNPLPSHFFDSNTLELTVNRDDGSLYYNFSKETFDLDITEVR